MPVVQLEHQIADFDMWKAAFDRDPIEREASGVRSYRIFRPVDDPKYIVVELSLDTQEQADAIVKSLHGLWTNAAAAPALAGKPKVRIVETVETHTY